MSEQNKCLKCGNLFSKTLDSCPKCGNIPVGLTLGAESIQSDIYALSAESIQSDIYANSSITSGLIKSISKYIDETTDSFLKLPTEEQERLGYIEINPQIRELKSIVSDLEERYKRLEEQISEKDEKYLKYKESLYVPDEILDILPIEVSKILQTVQHCFERGVPQACPVFIRKALATAITIRFKKDNNEDKLYDDNTDPFSLPKMIEFAKQEHYLSSYIARVLNQVKFFGDISAHDYKVDIKEGDVIQIFGILRVTLEHLYKNLS